MRCIRPLKAGYDVAGNITYSSRKFSKEIVGFEFECRKCIPCRLNMAREKAIRAYHEAQMHEKNIFLTLTYDEEHLKSEKLVHQDIQTFIDSLRTHIYRKNKATTKEAKELLYTPIMYTGEYGELRKRPHWHLIIFNYSPSDPIHDRTTELGEPVFTSQELSKIWQKGKIEFGTVTIESAGYVARYAAKKLVHGNDQDHDFHPIHRTPSRRAMGRSWIEKYWKQTFGLGYITLPNGQHSKIPRYYVDWLKKHHPNEWRTYVTEVRTEIQSTAESKARKESLEDIANIANYQGNSSCPLSRFKVKETILKKKFKRLQEALKL